MTSENPSWCSECVFFVRGRDKAQGTCLNRGIYGHAPFPLPPDSSAEYVMDRFNSLPTVQKLVSRGDRCWVESEVLVFRREKQVIQNHNT